MTVASLELESTCTVLYSHDVTYHSGRRVPGMVRERGFFGSPP